MYICIDFDNTIVEHEFPRIGQPVPGAVEWMKKWNALGAKLILFTIRSDDELAGRKVLSHAIEYLRNNGVELYGINENPDQLFSSSPKAYASLYIDDRGFGCPMYQPEGFSQPVVNWNVVGPEVEKLITEGKL